MSNILVGDSAVLPKIYIHVHVMNKHDLNKKTPNIGMLEFIPHYTQVNVNP